MTRVREPTPVGTLFKTHRESLSVSWERLKKAVGASDEAMQKWERGETKDPPLRKALLFAEATGIPLDVLAETVLGRPYKPFTSLGSVGASEEPDAIADAARVLPARERERRPSAPAPKPRHRARRSREE